MGMSDMDFDNDIPYYDDDKIDDMSMEDKFNAILKSFSKFNSTLILLLY